MTSIGKTSHRGKEKREKASSLSTRQWKELPPSCTLHLVSFQMNSRQERKGGKKAVITPSRSLEEGTDWLFLLYGNTGLEGLEFRDYVLK